MNQTKELINGHNCEIWQGENDGRWYTYLPDPVKGRVLKSRKEKKDLISLITKFYEKGSKTTGPCFPDEYADWIAERREFCEIAPSSLCRYESDYRRFFPENEKFCKIPIKDIEEIHLEHFIKRTIHDKESWDTASDLQRGAGR